MLTEEALILIATLTATGLLVLGVLELVWPSTSRRAVQRPRAMPRGRSPFEELLVPREDPAPRASRPVDAGVPEPIEAPCSAAADDIATASVLDPVEAPAPAEAAASPHERETEVPEEAAGREPRAHVLPIDTCLGMFDDARYAEVVSLGSAALEVHARLRGSADRFGEAAALTALIARARQRLGDRDGARAAYVAALRAAEPSARPTYVAHLVELADSAVDAGSGSDDTAGAESAAVQVRELLGSIASLDDALGIVSHDASLERARTAACEALVIAGDRLASDLVGGGGGDQARTLLLRALAIESMPAAWRERLGGQLTPVSSAEIGQLTAQAIRCVQEGRDGDALDALERAEGLFAALPAGTVPDERLEEFERRLWWGYTKVGLGRMDTNRFEEALAPLFHALRLGGIDEQRLGETRAALASALEALIDEKASALAVRGGDDLDARVVLDHLSALLETAIERGVREDELTDAVAKLETLKQALSRAAR